MRRRPLTMVVDEYLQTLCRVSPLQAPRGSTVQSHQKQQQQQQQVGGLGKRRAVVLGGLDVFALFAGRSCVERIIEVWY